jgi:pyruvate dehydrogenase E2 component (dihydrolipoamide acetyltransferase)
MPTSVVMPQMGESIAEGTIVRWIKKVGDQVARDEPLFEISTDKVDAEIPSPAAGVLAEIRAKEGETVPVDSVVAVIADAGATVAAPRPATPVPPPPQPPVAASAPGAAMPAPPASPEAPPPAGPAPPLGAAPSADELRRTRSSPLVRRIAREHDVDITQLEGSGVGGRVTKQDILDFIEGGAARPVPEATPSAAPAAQAGPAFKPGEAVEIVPMTVMRKRIAERMIASRRASAHVHSVFEVDFLKVTEIRNAKKAEFERLGVRLSYLPFIIKAAADALQAMPIVNASIDGDTIVYKRDINIGIAVALDWGLIVPVIRNADERNILGLTRAATDLAARARAKQLKPEDVQGGTFTITNPGVYGSLFGTAIINQPQVAILDVGVIEKRPVVVDDAIVIRPRAYLALGYDHRLIDGAVADQFMSFLKKRIEEFDPAACGNA